MLSRRFLRIKAYQSVFAYKQRVKSNYGLAMVSIDDFFSPDLKSMEKPDYQLLKKKSALAKNLFDAYLQDKEVINKESDLQLIESVEEAYELMQIENSLEKSRVKDMMLKDIELVQEHYIRALQFLLELSKIRTKVEGVSIPNRLDENVFFKLLDDNQIVKSLVAKYEIDWNDEEMLPRKTFIKRLAHLEALQLFTKEGHQSLDTDIKVIKKIIKKGLFKSDAVRDVFETKDTFWKENRDIVEGMLAITLKTTTKDELGLILLEGDKWEDDKAFYLKLYDCGTEVGSKVSKVFSDNLKNWEREKLSDSDDVIILLGLNEMAHFPSIPIKVTMNEYIEMAKVYSTPKSKTFVNGLLDSISKIMTKDKLIRKSGRGLLDNQ
jgi:N utilization substance protein B